MRYPIPLTLTLISWSPLAAQTLPHAKEARGKFGMVATGSAHATAAGVRILERGGTAADAAAAATFALMVTDPANTSLGGRAQILVRAADGGLAPIDGATQAPAEIRPKATPDEDRSGFAVVPVPGAVAALARLVAAHGRLSLSEVIRPALELAEQGFVVPPRLAASWAGAAPVLAQDPGAARHFLTPGGEPYRAGDRFVQPALARVLRVIADSGIDGFYRGSIGAAIARDVGSGGGFVRSADLAAYRAETGEVIQTSYRGRTVSAAGGRAWGHTLAEMLNILAQFPLGPGQAAARDIEILARVMAQALDDRPQVIGTLAPKPDGLPLARLISPEFARDRADRIRRAMAAGTLPDASSGEGRYDTSHLSVIDAAGNAVALTTSIGPSFGSRVASPELGFLFAHSYRMRAAPEPGARDLTEMTPTIVAQDGRPLLVLGAAGSERIPTAVLQVLSYVLDRGFSLEAAMQAPRLFALGKRIRLHDAFAADLAPALRARGFEVELVPRVGPPHLGLVHAVGVDPASGDYVGVADLGDSGAAAGPGTPLRPTGADRP